MEAENIIQKLKKINDDDNNPWKNWSLEEKHKLLEIYLIFSKKEEHIFQLIYNYHGTDFWEDIFRDYDYKTLEDKTSGVEIALKQVRELIEEKNKINKMKSR